MQERIKDMTAGKPAGLIIRFALPLMFGSMLQQAYTITDAAVVGRGVGMEALAAIGASDWLNWLVLGLCFGLTQGFSIVLSQEFGAQNHKALRKALTMSFLLTVLCGLIIMILALVTLSPTLKLMHTPEEIFPSAVLYLTILYCGIPIIIFYNLFSCVLRALGDSRTPLIAMAIASFLNILLDLLFVMVFHWGIVGAAVATLMAQLFSALYCLRIIRQIRILHLSKEDWRFDKLLCSRLLKLSIPIALQNGIISLGGLAVQYVANGFGVIFIAGYTATNKLYGLLELAAISFGYSMTTYMGQNLGAKKYARLRMGMRSGVTMAMITSVLVSTVMFLFGKWIISAFISSGEAHAEQVMQTAYTYLSILSSLLFILYLLHIYRASLMGLGNTVMPMVSGFIELIMRVSAAMILPGFIQEKGVFVAEVAAWTGAAAILMTSYYIIIRKLPRQDEILIQE